MESKIQRWGNSLGLRIPKSFAEEVQVEAGTPVDVSVEGGELVIRPLRVRKQDLRRLVKGITSTNLHDGIDTGAAVGREVW